MASIIEDTMASVRDDFEQKIIGLEAPIRANTECIGECRRQPAASL